MVEAKMALLKPKFWHSIDACATSYGKRIA
jgi:hypothetical protein